MPKRFISINLVKDQKGDLFERIINWALGVGRVLIIITELIALGAFLWRFGLDQQLVDLHTKIKQKQAIVAAFKRQEDEYRNLQDRLSIAQNFSEVGSKKMQIYKDILGLGEPGITFSKVSLSSDSIAIEINADSVTALSSFANKLKTYENIESVSIGKIETKTSSAVIVINITAKLKSIVSKYDDSD